MAGALLGPSLVVAAAIVAIVIAMRVLGPRPAAHVAGVGLVAAGLTTVWSLAGLAVPWAAHVLHSRLILLWCDHLDYRHSHVPAWAGIVSSAALAAGVWRFVSALVRRQRTIDHSALAGRPGVEVLEDRRARGFALPGRPGRVVLTTGLLDALSGDRERRAVIAHEVAHLDHRHYRFLLAGDLAVAVAPFLAPLRTRMRFALERWADEVAGREVGDRSVVARAIARVALAEGGSPAPNALGVASQGVPARVEALLAPLPGRRVHLTSGAVALLAFAVTAAMLQLRHVVVLIVQVC